MNNKPCIYIRSECLFNVICTLSCNGFHAWAWLIFSNRINFIIESIKNASSTVITDNKCFTQVLRRQIGFFSQNAQVIEISYANILLESKYCDVFQLEISLVMYLVIFISIDELQSKKSIYLKIWAILFRFLTNICGFKDGIIN